jgi:AcrR family transcriptional regulator
MATGSRRLPRAVREQQMLDSAVQVFSENGFHGTSMEVIATAAGVSKPMLYLYYGSKDELFAACIQRETLRFLEAIAGAGDPTLTPREQVRTGLVGFLTFVDEHRASWQVLYRQAIGLPAFTGQVSAARQRLVGLVAKVLESSSRNADMDFPLVAVALVGAGEAIADHIADGTVSVEGAADMLQDLAWRGLSGRRRE